MYASTKGITAGTMAHCTTRADGIRDIAAVTDTTPRRALRLPPAPSAAAEAHAHFQREPGFISARHYASGNFTRRA